MPRRRPLPEKVIFACVHSAGRSQMAAAWFNALTDSNLVKAHAAGTEPGPRVHPEVVDAMKEAGLDLSGKSPQLLTVELAADAKLLVTMGCGEQCPVLPGVERDDWPLEDPKGKSPEAVRRIRDEIRARVEGLIRSRGWGRLSARAGDKSRRG